MGNVSGRSNGEGNFEDGGEPYSERIDDGIRVSLEPSRMSSETMHSHDRRPIPGNDRVESQRQASLPHRIMGQLGTNVNRRFASLKEPMHRSGEEFILVKLLPSGLYHYRFIVDGNLMYDQNGPFSFDDPGGNAYNILDVKEFAAESCENVPESALPDSPEESYRRNSVHDVDFSKPRPENTPHRR